MAGQRLAGANQARADATAATIGGVSEMVGGTALGAGVKGAFGEDIQKFLTGEE